MQTVACSNQCNLVLCHNTHGATRAEMPNCDKEQQGGKALKREESMQVKKYATSTK